jgi:hypothetical protein
MITPINTDKNVGDENKSKELALLQVSVSEFSVTDLVT